MAARQGYKARLFITANAAAASGTMIQIGSTKSYRADDVTRIWDPEATFVIQDNAVTVSPSNYTIDYLLNRVTFADSYTVTGPVTYSGENRLRQVIGLANGVSLNLSANMLDKTFFQDTAVDRLAGLFDCTGTIDTIDDGLEDYDSSGTDGSFYAILNSRRFMILEINPDTDFDFVFRVCAQFEQVEAAAQVDDLVRAILTYQGRLVGNLTRSFSFGELTP